ncbi:MAG: 2-C-methyl-D-erythritol 4-phosphate cytidylyltransferase, partial [Candidatus Omnitrophica bacterium]|nr:2-C-methyl-D-erythritol 4-phosphate cytidylyltransferase [Candidatus Omnitrophota bacterium]
MKTEAIIAAAGVGKRIRTKTPKPYLNIQGRPILLYTLLAINRSKYIDRIIVVVRKADKEKCLRLIRRYKVKKVKAVVSGGAERRDSVYRGLGALDADADLVLVHDGVRPFIDEGMIRRSVTCAKEYGACVVGVPVKA